VGETPEGLLRPQTIGVGPYEKRKLNGTGPEIATLNFVDLLFHDLDE
jgi:hypothetical protein